MKTIYILLVAGLAINAQSSVGWAKEKNSVLPLPGSSIEEGMPMNTWEEAVRYARSHNDRKLEEALLQKRSNMIIDKVQTLSLLSYVCSSGYYPLVEFLLNHEGDEYGKNDMGTTNLMFACCTNWNQTGNREDNRRIIKFFLSRGHLIDECSENGLTPLLTTAVYGDLETLKYLEEQGANIKAVMEDGKSALFLAAINQDVSMVQYLLTKIPDMINKKTTLGERVLDVAVSRPSKEITQMLIERGAIPGEREKNPPVRRKRPPCR